MVAGSMAVRLMAYRTYLFAISVLSLAVGFYLSYRRRLGPRWNRVVLWTATVVSAVFWSVNYLMRLINSYRVR